MKYVAAVVGLAVMCSICEGWAASDGLPVGSEPPAIEFRHFPDRLHAFVWRNWELVSAERMARVLDTTPENVRRIGASMGLPGEMAWPQGYEQRAYISIIRRNWHILPYEQLLTLLDWDAKRLAFTLREDDFLWIKLGSLKPACPPLRYTAPNASATQRCEAIQATVSDQFDALFAEPAVPRFDFFRSGTSAGVPEPIDKGGDGQPIRFLYSYFGIVGDPLADPELDPYPDALLRRLSACGVNGVWLHVVLRQLAPSEIFPEFGDGHEVRLATLRRLVNRASRHGIKVYLYMNEPRAMPEPFFQDRKPLRGVREADHFTLCTSAEPVRRWLRESLCYVFRNVPGLGGVFTITGSENLTHCYSHSRDAASCPRCSKRSGPEVIAEVNRTIAEGVRLGNPDAAVIVWDWGWPDGTPSGWGHPDWASQIIPMLPDDVHLMSVSEWSKPIERGGVSSRVGEYSISSVGPGPRARKHWGLAREHGLKTVAKMQVNASWELSAVPWLPVLNLVARHCGNLRDAGVDGMMLSWTVGGYPSPSLDLVRRMQLQPAPTEAQALRETAESRYGAQAASQILEAWSRFSEAFTEYPFHVGLLYSGPVQCGPANLLYPEPTGYRATMVGFPYDDVQAWRGIYPAEVLAEQFEKVALGWRTGLVAFEAALPQISPDRRAQAREDLAIAEAAYLHFRSVANQVRFILARDALRSDPADPAEQSRRIDEVRAIVQDEIDSAVRLFALTRADPRIGFEASNQYYYTPLDLMEKVINCQYVLDPWLAAAEPEPN